MIGRLVCMRGLPVNSKCNKVAIRMRRHGVWQPVRRGRMQWTFLYFTQRKKDGVPPCMPGSSAALKPVPLRLKYSLLLKGDTKVRVNGIAGT